MERRTIFGQRLLPMVLVAPQFLLTLIFFLWPACEAVWSSLTRQDPFGLHSQFAGLDNFVELFTDPLYRRFDWPHRVFHGRGQRSVDEFGACCWRCSRIVKFAGGQSIERC